jgi:hypothetical protein
LEDVEIVGKGQDGSILFAKHPFALVPGESHPEDAIVQRFETAVPWVRKLDRVELSVKGRQVRALDRSKRAEVDLGEARRGKAGVSFEVRGSYDRLNITAHDPITKEWRHLFLNDKPTERGRTVLNIPWDRFPVAANAVIRAVAIRGADVAVSSTRQIVVRLQRPKLHVFCAGFRKSGENIEYFFRARASLHGKPIPVGDCSWRIDGKRYRGPNAAITRGGEKRFKIEVKLAGSAGKTATARNAAITRGGEKRFMTEAKLAESAGKTATARLVVDPVALTKVYTRSAAPGSEEKASRPVAQR